MASRIIPCLAAAALVVGVAHAATAQTYLWPVPQAQPPSIPMPYNGIPQYTTPQYQPAPLIGQGMFPSQILRPPPGPILVMPMR